jgi:hypothetical protein
MRVCSFRYSDLRASLNANNLPEDVQSRLLDLHEQNVSLKEQMKSANEKLLKAKSVRFVQHCFDLLLNLSPVH